MKLFFQRLANSASSLLGVLWKERLWWLVPFVATLVLVAFLLVFAQSSPLAPFLYTAF